MINNNKNRIILTLNQYKVLICCKHAATHITSINRISMVSGVKQNTVKSIIKTFQQKGMINTRRMHFGAGQWGIQCTCTNLFQEGDFLLKDGKTPPENLLKKKELDSLPLSSASKNIPHLKCHHISSSKNTQNTTTTNVGMDDQIIHPQSPDFVDEISTYLKKFSDEMLFWKELGLGIEQLQKWCAELELPTESVLQSASALRWDIIFGGKQVIRPVSYLYGSLSRYGKYFPSPKFKEASAKKVMGGIQEKDKQPVPSNNGILLICTNPMAIYQQLIDPNEPLAKKINRYDLNYLLENPPTSENGLKILKSILLTLLSENVIQLESSIESIFSAG